MGLAPEDLYEVDSDVPDLHGAVLLYRFDGFMDAGSAGRLFTDHLLDTFEHRVIARFDVDQLIDYRARRPSMIFATDKWTDYDAPELVLHLLWDTEGTPFLLLVGPEPDYQWERFTKAVIELVERWELRLTAGFHGIPMGVPHTRPLGVTAHANRSDLIAGFEPFFNRVQVPGSANALLELRLGERGHDVVGFAAQVPHYLAQTTYPAAAMTILNSVTTATGLAMPDTALRESARRADVEIDRQVADSDEVADVVQALERQYDAYADGANKQSLLADAVEGHIPTADELASEFEQFLAEQGHAEGDH
ncbi:MAG TPA: PAC2 family protein [Pseudonocardiaceae bacterium]|nr:PAC2 family protein [Pseudonocardiaceae bacterium]